MNVLKRYILEKLVFFKIIMTNQVIINNVVQLEIHYL
jgi:hypothetical protein